MSLALLQVPVMLRPRSTSAAKCESLHLGQETVGNAVSRNVLQVPLPSAPKAGIQAQVL